MNTKIQIKRVLSVRSTDPGVLATVDRMFVKWHARRGWTCTCRDSIDGYECIHIGQVKDVLDPSVTTLGNDMEWEEAV